VHPVHRSAAEGHRVLISAPYGRDAESVSQLLTNHGCDAAICLSLDDLAAGIDDHAGVVLVTAEALAGDLAPLRRALVAQPAWSDIPFILLAGRPTGRVRTSEAVRRRLPDNTTNVILLERPLSAESLLSTITVALRARQRQFQMRDQLAELDAQRTRLAEAAEGLEAEVAARTSDLKQALDDLRRESAERLRAEASLRQSQKMEAVGQLTGGVAHDFNNMLTGIIGAIDIMKRRMASNRYDDLERFMDAASVSAGRAAALTSRLLAFSRRQSLDSKPTDISGLVLSLSDLIAAR
jgi:signal transduction histidine kinase